MSAKSTHIRILISSLILFANGCASPPATMESAATVFPLTSTPNQLSNGDILISFIKDASDGMDEISACLGAYNSYRFVLFGSGQLIRYDEDRYWEAGVSQADIDKLLSEIEATGFSSLAGDGDQYVRDVPQPVFVNTWGGSITVKEKTIMIKPGQSDYLVESVINTLDILEKYKPENLQLYAPKSASLWVFLEDSLVLGSANPTPEPPDLEWSADEIKLDSLLTNLTTSKPRLMSDDSLSLFMGQLKHIPAFRKAKQDGKTYFVILCPNFPQ